MTDERTPPPAGADEKTTTEAPSPPVETLQFSSALPEPRAFPWTRAILYGAVLAAGLAWFFWRTAAPAIPREVFQNADRIDALEWPDSGTRLVATDAGWEVSHASWDRAAADPTAVLALLDRLKGARGLPLRRIPPDFRPVGRLIVSAAGVRRTLVWHAAGADAVVESGNQRFLVPSFPADQLFPAPESLVTRRLLGRDPGDAGELSVTVVTAEGERRYRIRREGDYWYIPGTHAHLLHTPAVVRLLADLRELSFRRLLPSPATWPSLVDFSLTQEGRTWRLARITGECPEGELAVARQDGRWLAGCVSARAWARLVPTLPALLEPRLVPPPGGGGTWDHLELRHRGSPALRIARGEKGWTFEDGTPADAAICAGLIERWTSSNVLGLEPLLPTDQADTQVFLRQGKHEFYFHVLSVGDAFFAVRQGERRRARIPKELFDLVRPDPAWWRDRRVFPHDDVVKIQRTSDGFRETWVREADGTWRVLEPLDLPYPPELATEVIPRLMALRSEAPTTGGTATDATPTAATPTAGVEPGKVPGVEPASPETPDLARTAVLWTLTRTDGTTIRLWITPGEGTSRALGDGPKTALRLAATDEAFLLQPHFRPHRPAWELARARGAVFRFADGRTVELELRDSTWLWTAPEGKKLLPADAAGAFLARLDKALEEAEPWDLGTIPDCPIRLSFTSDLGLPQAFCLETAAGIAPAGTQPVGTPSAENPSAGFLLIARAGLPGRSLLPASFLSLLAVP